MSYQDHTISSFLRGLSHSYYEDSLTKFFFPMSKQRHIIGTHRWDRDSMFAACIVSIYYYLVICYSFCVKWCGASAATLYRWRGHVRRAHNSLTSPNITPNRRNHPRALEFWMFKWFHAMLLTTCLRTYFSTTSRFNFILKSMQRGMQFKILLWNRWPYSNWGNVFGRGWCHLWNWGVLIKQCVFFFIQINTALLLSLLIVFTLFCKVIDSKSPWFLQCIRSLRQYKPYRWPRENSNHM
jgi:hypothetical protein